MFTFLKLINYLDLQKFKGELAAWLICFSVFLLYMAVCISALWASIYCMKQLH